MIVSWNCRIPAIIGSDCLPRNGAKLVTAGWGEDNELFLFAIGGRGRGWRSRKLPRKQARFVELYRVIERPYDTVVYLYCIQY